jgi:hypothetical protein
MSEFIPARVLTRFQENQPLWVLVGPDGTLLCGRHAQAGPVLLSWTTREEMEEGVHALFDRAPMLFETHQPEQRAFRDLMLTAARLRMRLRIDEFVVEAAAPDDPAGDSPLNGPGG